MRAKSTKEPSSRSPENTAKAVARSPSWAGESEAVAFLRRVLASPRYFAGRVHRRIPRVSHPKPLAYRAHNAATSNSIASNGTSLALHAAHPLNDPIARPVQLEHLQKFVEGFDDPNVPDVLPLINIELLSPIEGTRSRRCYFADPVGSDGQVGEPSCPTARSSSRSPLSFLQLARWEDVLTRFQPLLFSVRHRSSPLKQHARMEPMLSSDRGNGGPHDT